MLNYDSNRTYPAEKKQKKRRPFLLTALGLLVVFGFFFTVMLLFFQGEGGALGKNNGGSGTAESGGGSGSGTEKYGTGISGDGAASSGDSKTGSGTEHHEDQSKNQNVTPPDGYGSKTDQTATVSPKEKNMNGKEDGMSDDVMAQIEIPPANILVMPKENRKIPVKQKNISSSQIRLTPDHGSSAGSGSAGLAGKKGFFGMKVQGNAIFVVDVSGSMAEGPCCDRQRKIDVLKWQLKNAIETTKHVKDGWFAPKYAILAFSGSGTCYSPANDFKLYPNNGKMKKFSLGVDKETEAFIDSLQANGGTPVLGAMQKVKELLDKKVISIKTIFILTDGLPDTPWHEIREYIKNEIPKKIVINTISIGQTCNEMKELAKERNGTCKEIL